MPIHAHILASISHSELHTFPRLAICLFTNRKNTNWWETTKTFPGNVVRFLQTSYILVLWLSVIAMRTSIILWQCVDGLLYGDPILCDRVTIIHSQQRPSCICTYNQETAKKVVFISTFTCIVMCVFECWRDSDAWLTLFLGGFMDLFQVIIDFMFSIAFLLFHPGIVSHFVSSVSSVQGVSMEV